MNKRKTCKRHTQYERNVNCLTLDAPVISMETIWTGVDNADGEKMTILTPPCDIDARSIMVSSHPTCQECSKEDHETGKVGIKDGY